jgi:peptidoglycan/xylan/chitin deacetylase (PgdA/CDA1 family)
MAGRMAALLVHARTQTLTHSGSARLMDTYSLKRLPGRALWRMPFRFVITQVLGVGYSLRCVLFHDVSDQPSSFTHGLGVSMTTRAFEETLRFLKRHYTLVSLDWIVHSGRSRESARRPLLVTFDDAYASVALNAAEMCRKYRVPALFFVNGRFLNNSELALDNLVCHVVNTRGYDPINAVASDITGVIFDLRSFRQIFGVFLPSLSLKARQAFYSGLAGSIGLRPQAAAQAAGLYISSAQLRALTSLNFGIGNHTYSHVHGRTLQPDEFAQEIDLNRSVLESIAGKRVQSFSVPYGSSADLPVPLARHLEERGYDAVFLVERKMNTPATGLRHVYRVSLQQGTDAELFSELEVMPRLRALRSVLFQFPGQATLPRASGRRADGRVDGR